jgi:hypothetical protein
MFQPADFPCALTLPLVLLARTRICSMVAHSLDI